MVSKQQCLGVIFDIQLKWCHYVAGICKSMSYYLSLIRSLAKNLLSSIIKMLLESLVFFSQFVYALPVWAPAKYS